MSACFNIHFVCFVILFCKLVLNGNLGFCGGFCLAFFFPLSFFIISLCSSPPIFWFCNRFYPLFMSADPIWICVLVCGWISGDNAPNILALVSEPVDFLAQQLIPRLYYFPHTSLGNWPSGAIDLGNLYGSFFFSLSISEWIVSNSWPPQS